MSTYSPFLLSMSLAAAAALAQDAPRGEPATKPATRPVATAGQACLAPGEWQLPALAAFVSQVTHHNILWNDREVVDAAPITLTEPVPLDPETAEDTLCSLLFTRRLALLPVDAKKGIYEVISIVGQRGRELEEHAEQRTPEQVLAAPDSKRVVVTTVRLQNQNPAVVVNSLRPMLGGGAGAAITLGLTVDRDGLILRGFQSQVAAALKMIAEPDQATKPLPETETAALRARIEALEKQLAQLQQQLAELRRAAGK